MTAAGLLDDLPDHRFLHCLAMRNTERLKRFVVFNAAQCDGLPTRLTRRIRGLGAAIANGDRM
jgi:hypothetical protein